MVSTWCGHCWWKIKAEEENVHLQNACLVKLIGHCPCSNIDENGRIQLSAVLSTVQGPYSKYDLQWYCKLLYCMDLDKLLRYFLISNMSERLLDRGISQPNDLSCSVVLRIYSP